MLVLSRKVNETLVVDGVIEVRVLDVKGSRVRLGIVAPEEIHIRRGELVCQNLETSPPPAVGVALS